MKNINKNSFDVEKDIQTWIKEKIEEGYQVIAVPSRRCFNLIHSCLNETKNYDDFSSNIITDSALLVLADNLANLYIQNHHFINVLIMDDTLVHGRNLNLFLSKFQTIMLDYIKKHGKDIDLKQAEDDFYSSINISIYAINSGPLLLKQEYQQRLRYRHCENEENFRKISNTISNLLANMGIANTSYIISAKEISSQPNENHKTHISNDWTNNWIEAPKLSRFNTEHRFFYLKGFENIGIVPSVHMYQKGNYTFYTPYCLFPRIYASQLLTILKTLIENLENKNNKIAKAFTGYFNKVAKHRDRLLVYGQLFELIISQITLKIFLDSYNENFGKLEYDYTKIASNFSIVSKEDSKFNILLKELIDIDWTVEELKDIVISDNLTNLTNEKSISEQLHCYINIRDKNVEYAVELSAYELSIKHEKYVNELINSFLERRFQPISENNSTGEYELYKLVYQVAAETDGQSCIYETMILALEVIILLTDLGLIDLKTRVITDENGHVNFYSAICVNSLSMSILPKLLGNYFMSFIRFAEFYWWESDFEKRVEKYFTEDICQGIDDEAKANQVTQYAKDIAKLIHNYPDIVESILNWRFIRGKKL